MVKLQTLDFGLGHDPRVMRSNPVLGSVLAMEPAWDSLLPSPSVPPHLSARSLSLSQNKQNHKTLCTLGRCVLHFLPVVYSLSFHFQKHFEGRNVNLDDE